MCKHVPIKIYDSGGTQSVCANCGKPLSEWIPNSGSNKHRYDKKNKKEDKTVVHS